MALISYGRKVLGWTAAAVQDTIDTVAGRRDPLTAPRYLRKRVNPARDPRAFRAIGDAFVRDLVDLCALKPADAVLDAGCGCGQVAASLTRYLDARGRYDGFDVDRAMIDWSRRHIGAANPNFRFTYVDIFNNAYNAGGTVRASGFRFPYDDAVFDVVFAKSLFTHMFPDDCRQYLAEMTRVLKPGGRCLNTFLLINDESTALIRGGRSALPLAPAGDYWTTNPERQEDAIGLDEGWLRQQYRAVVLEITAVRYGGWCGRASSADFQDFVIAEKRA